MKYFLSYIAELDALCFVQTTTVTMTALYFSENPVIWSTRLIYTRPALTYLYHL